LSEDVNKLVEEMDVLEVVDDDDINSEDEFDGDYYCNYYLRRRYKKRISKFM
jgi:hypothetical protein